MMHNQFFLITQCGRKGIETILGAEHNALTFRTRTRRVAKHRNAEKKKIAHRTIPFPTRC